MNAFPIYKSPWETLHVFPWLQIRTLVAETGFAWNEFRWAPAKKAVRK